MLIACNCLTADHDLDTLQERERECWLLEARTLSLEVFVLPKDLLRCATTGPDSFSSIIAIVRSVSAFFARRSCPSPKDFWFGFRAIWTISKYLWNCRICSMPSRIALQTSRALTERSKNSATWRSSGGRETATPLLTRIARNSSWQTRNASRSFRIQDRLRRSSPERSWKRSATCFWKESSSMEPLEESSWWGSMEWTCSRRMLRSERPSDANGTDEPWYSVAGILT